MSGFTRRSLLSRLVASMGALVAGPALAGQRPRARRSFQGKGFGGEAGTAGFSDWTYAWDFTAGNTSSPGDIPALFGGLDLPLIAGSYSRGTNPSFVDPVAIGVDLTSAGPITGSGAEFDLTGATALTGSVGGTHVRWACRRAAGASGAFIVGNSFTSGPRIQISPAEGRMRVFVFDGTNSLICQADLYHGITDAVAVDVHVYNETGSNTRVDLHVNGQFATDSDGTHSWAGVGTARVLMDGVSDDQTFAGIRMTDTPVTQTQHRAFLNDWIDGMLVAGRAVDHRWLAEDASSGAAWIDHVGSYSVPWTGSGGSTVSTVATTGISRAAVGASRAGSALRVDSNNATITDFVWQNATAGDAALAVAAGESMWIRAVVRHIDPATNDGDHSTVFEIRDASPVAVAKLVRLLQYDTASNGGGSGSVFDNAGPVNTVITAAPDTRAEWNIFDLYIDGAAGTMQLFINNKASASASVTSPDAFIDPYFGLLRQADCDTALIQIVTGADADVFDANLHAHDVALLQAA